MANAIFIDPKSAYNAKTEEEAIRFTHPDWVDNVLFIANKYKEIFGKDNFFIEIQAIDQDKSPAATVVAKGLRYIAKKYKFQSVATADSHYPRREDAEDQLLLLCSSMKTTLRKAKGRLKETGDSAFSGFLNSNSFHIPTLEEIQAVNTAAEIDMAMQVSSMCED